MLVMQLCCTSVKAFAAIHSCEMRPAERAGHTTTELFASGGVHALVRLLDNVLEYAREPQRSVWVREVLALLYPLARRSRMVARLLVCAAAHLGSFLSPGIAAGTHLLLCLHWLLPKA